jgi:hypothetical protein
MIQIAAAFISNAVISRDIKKKKKEKLKIENSKL